MYKPFLIFILPLVFLVFITDAAPRLFGTPVTVNVQFSGMTNKINNGYFTKYDDHKYEVYTSQFPERGTALGVHDGYLWANAITLNGLSRYGFLAISVIIFECVCWFVVYILGRKK